MFIVFLLAGMLAAAELPTRRFDMGTDHSPVAAGFEKVTAETAYTRQRGHGWETAGQQDFDVARPPENPSWRQPTGQMIPKDYIQFKEHTDLTRDGVMSAQDLVFRADVPNGNYRVAVTMGHLDKPLGSMQLFVNDSLAAAEIHAKHIVQRGRPDLQYGFPKHVRHTVAVTDGAIRIRLHGDDRLFRKHFEEEFHKPALSSYLTGGLREDKKPARPDVSRWGQGRGVVEVWVWRDIGAPFTANAVNSIEIYPREDPPLYWTNGALRTASIDPSTQRGVAAFNAERWRDAEAAFDSVRDEYTRAVGYLWLAGRPQYEEELRLLPKALQILERLAPARRSDLVFAELFEGARRMKVALDRFVHRADHHRTYTELLLISGEVDSMQPEDPLYYKARIYAARGLYMVIPHRWAFTAPTGQQILEEVGKAGFASNRFVKWYLEEEWSSDWQDWRYADYSAKKRGAPSWAAEIYEAYNRELDLAEWWFGSRQREDGSLGGSWGDDVEVLRSFGAFVAASPDASPVALNGVRKVADGSWNSGSVDTEAGYFSEVSDTEHSGEWTADTLTAMTRIDFGNPVYIERALKTGKLMRDLWMDFNSRGHFLMRSNFLGAAGVGGPGTQNDSRINYRPASPAYAVLRYNNLPALKKLFVQWADAWLAASMSTEKEKPRGIIPQEIGFERSEIGGTNAPNWFTADHRPGQDVNYDWEGAGGYHEAIAELFLFAAQATSDKKYLTPLEIQDAFVREHCPKRVCDSETVRNGRLHASLWKDLKPGSNEWIAARLATWPRQWEIIQKGRGDLVTLDQAASRAAEENEWARKRWPHVTTECIATDRVYWRGLGNALRLMTAYGVTGQSPLVTYRGLGRDFAAVVRRADPAKLEIVLFNMDTTPKDAAVVPWGLELGAEYTWRIGNQSGRARIQTLGHEIRFRLPGRTEMVLDVTRVSEGIRSTLLPDLAISASDVRYVADLQRVDVTLHNVGSAAARGVTVIAIRDGKEIGRHRVPNIEAPLDLDPKTVRIGFPLPPVSEKSTIRIMIDPDDKIVEITERNNRVTVEVSTPKVPRRQHSSA